MKQLIPKFKDGSKYEPKKNKEGKYIINPNNPQDVKFLHELQGKRGAKAAANKGDIVKGIVDAATWVTPLGDAEDVISIYQDTKKGNYGSALLTAGLLLPGLVIPGSLNKGKKLISKKARIDAEIPSPEPKSVKDYEVPEENIQRYKDLKNEVETHKTFNTPDVNVIEDNVLREIAWIPNDKVQLSKNTFTTLQNAIRRMNEPMYSDALSKYLQDLRKSGNLEKLNTINKGIERVNLAKEVVKNPSTRTFQGIMAIPEEDALNDGYSFLVPGVSGITFPDLGDAKAYVKRPVEDLRNRSTTPLHENEHVYQWLMGRSTGWDNAYTPKQKELFNEVYQTSPTLQEAAESATELDKGATNKEFQRLMQDAYTQEYGKVPSYWDLNRYIENAPEEQLIKLFNTENPVNIYHTDYLNYWKTKAKDPKFVSKWVRQFRNVLKFGPALATPFAINALLPKEQEK